MLHVISPVLNLRHSSKSHTLCGISPFQIFYWSRHANAELTTEQLSFQLRLFSFSMVYLFLLVCFSLNPSITLLCKMVKVLACATFIVYFALLIITLAENALAALDSAVYRRRVNKYYLLFFSLRSTAFLDCFLQLNWEY